MAEGASGPMRAALLGAHFSSWRREKLRHPVYIPPALDRFAPMPEGRVVATLRSAKSTNADQWVRRCATAEIERPTGNHRGRVRALSGEHRACFDELTERATEERRTVCACCVAYELEHARQRATPPAHVVRRFRGEAKRKNESPVATEHASNIQFDDATWITTASERVQFTGVRLVQAERVFQSADPRQWRFFGPDLFKASDQGTWERGTWKPTSKLELNVSGVPRAPSEFQLREYVVWNWGEEVQGGAENILQITKFESSSNRIAYRYSLHHCIKARFLATWEPGGLDVDEGHFLATWEPKDGGTLLIRSEKKLRYTEQATSPPRFTMFMNLLAPSLTSLFLRQLAYQGVRRVLDEPLASGPRS